MPGGSTETAKTTPSVLLTSSETSLSIVYSNREIVGAVSCRFSEIVPSASAGPAGFHLGVHPAATASVLPYRVSVL